MAASSAARAAAASSGSKAASCSKDAAADAASLWEERGDGGEEGEEGEGTEEGSGAGAAADEAATSRRAWQRAFKLCFQDFNAASMATLAAVPGNRTLSKEHLRQAHVKPHAAESAWRAARGPSVSK
mmetsp:Transcript_29864/g.75161  ORF Transcript_29864/g.75161 Transcript_29864/m.75161 type:complete len:127 (-) Transcript_29864:1075-1455(-)